MSAKPKTKSKFGSEVVFYNIDNTHIKFEEICSEYVEGFKQKYINHDKFRTLGPVMLESDFDVLQRPKQRLLQQMYEEQFFSYGNNTRHKTSKSSQVPCPLT